MSYSREKLLFRSRNLGSLCDESRIHRFSVCVSFRLLVLNRLNLSLGIIPPFVTCSLTLASFYSTSECTCLKLNALITRVIIQHMRALPIYGQNVNDICHPYITDILRYSYVAKICPKSCKALHNYSFSMSKMCFVDNLLNNKTIILLNLAEYRLILANSAYGLVG